MENWREHIFFPNDEMPEEDTALFDEMLSKDLGEKEREFFEQLKKKEEGEFAVEGDLLLDERFNEEQLYILRNFFTEYRIGRGLDGHRSPHWQFADTLADALNVNLSLLLGRDITLLDWLRETDFRYINYNGNYELRD